MKCFDGLEVGPLGYPSFFEGRGLFGHDERKQVHRPLFHYGYSHRVPGCLDVVAEVPNGLSEAFWTCILGRFQIHCYQMKIGSGYGCGAGRTVK